MRKLYIGLILSVLILTGCSWDKSDLSDGLKLRQLMQTGQGCTFHGDITADYGDRIYEFAMDCAAKPTGDVEFVIAAPESIQGISGVVSQTGGKLTFDDTVLLFEPLTQGQVTPAIAPWLMVKAIQGGYIRSVSEQDGETELVLDDSFGTEKFQVTLTLDKEGLPKCCEIFWQNRRILTVMISNFRNV